MKKRLICGWLVVGSILLSMMGCSAGGVAPETETNPVDMADSGNRAEAGEREINGVETAQRGNRDEPEEDIAMPLPDFTLLNLEGEEVTLSQLEGKVVVMNFWASWCGPCKTEMPDFQTFYEKTRERDDVIFLSLNLTDNREETRESAERYMNENGFTFPVYLDEDCKVGAIYGVRNIPTTLVSDTRGRLHDYRIGMTTLEMVEEMVEGALEK